ncbi:MAG TPA: TVP38/TMEM64 family protein [Roseiflexaceae bacterium]|nr:TVP38/TMEM64 family protein [Roseiflexaceae bacterium]
MNETSAVEPPSSWLRRNVQKLLVLAFWLAVLGGYQWYAWSNGLSPLEVVQRLLDFLSGSPYGPLLYILIYAVRPLFLFSAVLLTVAGGFLFGPLWGIVYVLIGSNTSATIAYAIGRFLGAGVLEGQGSDGLVQRYAERMRRNSFETVLIMRFVFLPYDLVNYLAGFLRIRWTPFILATVLGSLPGTLAFVLFGASIERFDGGLPALNPWSLVASVVIFVASLGLARLFRRRESGDS